MNWCIPSGAGSCSASGGSDTGADEDAAFALLQASKVFGGTYKTDALKIIADIWSHDIDIATKLPKGGSNYASPSTSVTSPSVFAPAYYAAFMAAGDTNDWQSVITAVYSVINGSLSGSNGLLPGWCANNCTAAGSNGGATDTIYQYDSHHVPQRVALDYCFNNSDAAKTYSNRVANFFSTNANAGLNGTSRIFDLYQLSGVVSSGASAKSASAFGAAALSAMAAGSNQTFINDAYQAVFDLATRGTLETSGYTYRNATPAMVALLILTGNFSH